MTDTLFDEPTPEPQLVTVLALYVPGHPVPQGSMSAIPVGRRRRRMFVPETDADGLPLLDDGGAPKGRWRADRFVPVTREDGVPIVNQVSSNGTRLKEWRSLVKQAAYAKWKGRGQLWQDVTIHITFEFVRPIAHHGTGRNSHILRTEGLEWPRPTIPRSPKLGDLDKLQRAVFDALDDAGVYEDDGLIDECHVRKRWAAAYGAHIWVQVDPNQHPRSRSNDE